MDLSRAPPEGSNGNKGVGFPPVTDSGIYILSFRGIVFPGVSNPSALNHPSAASLLATGTPPETGSGGSMCSIGNKGVDTRGILLQGIYTLFFCQIQYWADSSFSSSISGESVGLIYIIIARMAIPVAPRHPMEIKGSPLHPFHILLNIPIPGAKPI
jgi:hypothetical protein